MATFAMMCLHISGSNWGSQPVNSLNWQVFNFYDSLVRFCVPVFVMISGVFFLDPRKPLKLNRLFKRNILRIVTAFLFWSVVYAVYQLWRSINIDQQTGPGLRQAFVTNVINGNYHMWFLFTIAALYLITPLLRRISNSRRATEYFLILSFVFCDLVNLLVLVPTLGGHISGMMGKAGIHFVLGYTGYFFLGHYLHQYDLSRTAKHLLYFLAGASLLFTIGVTSFWSLKSGIAHEELYNYLLPNTFFVSSAVFVLFKSHVSPAGLNKVVIAVVQKLSTLSFGMYLVHDLFNSWFHDVGISTVSFHPFLSVPLISCAVFLLSAATAMIIHKIPILNRYIM